MFCVQCGKQLPDGSKFCVGCGAKMTDGSTPQQTADTPVLPVKTGGSPKMKLALIAGAAVLAVIVVVAAVFGAVSNSGRNYVYKSISKSMKAYAKEYDDFVNKNAVLKQTKSNLSQAYTQKLTAGPVKVTLSDDKKTKALYLNVSAAGIPIRAYLTDTRLIVGSPSVAYLEADPKKLGSDFENFLDSAGAMVGFEYTDSIAEELNKLDLSYSNVTGANITKAAPELAQMSENYLKLLKKLIDKADYEKEKSSVTIGDKEVKTTQIVLSADAKVIESWFKQDLLPTLKADKQLQSYFDTIADTYNTGYDYFPDMDEFLDELESQFEDAIDYMDDNEVEFVVRADVYKGVIVSVEFEYIEDDDSLMTCVASALGEKYRLNRVQFTAKPGGGGDSFKFTAAGDHIGSSVVTSAITVDDYGYKEKVSFEWDTEGSSNNLRLKAGSETVKATFALDGNDVRLSFDPGYGDSVTWRLSALEDSVELPSDTILIRDSSVLDVIELVSEVEDVFDGF